MLRIILFGVKSIQFEVKNRGTDDFWVNRNSFSDIFIQDLANEC